jgi:hypothetical protein
MISRWLQMSSQQVRESVIAHSVRPSPDRIGFIPMKVVALTEQQKPLIQPVSDALAKEAGQVASVLKLLDRVIYAHSGGVITWPRFVFEGRRQRSEINWWPAQVYWFSGLFALFAVAFLLISVCFFILCRRAAADPLFQAAPLASGGVLLVLFWGWFTKQWLFQLVVPASIIAIGIASCLWALASGKVGRLHKVACLAIGFALPFLVYPLFSYAIQDCQPILVYIFLPDNSDIVAAPSCGQIEQGSNFWLVYPTAFVIALILIAEAFLAAWRKIVVKPNG